MFFNKRDNKAILEKILDYDPDPWKWEINWHYPKTHSIKEVDGKHVMEFEMPGLSSDDISVEVEENILHVFGEKGDRKYDYKLYIYKYTDDIEAKVENGILYVTLRPKDKDIKLIDVK